MGKGYLFKCKKCGEEYNVMTGIGFLFYEDYKRVAEDIKKGKYGEKWQKIMKDTSHIVVDAESYIYICDSCGNWRTEPDLSLYKPKNIIEASSGDKTEENDDYIYTWSDDFREKYELMKTYVHKCSECGKTTRKISLEEAKTLQCPKCKALNEYDSFMFWD